jgi:hypothetical protein
VRCVVGAALSLIFSYVVENRVPAAGDGYDLWHAVLGSTADAFMTCDARLARNLSRIPVDDFHVVTSLAPLLAG